MSTCLKEHELVRKAYGSIAKRTASCCQSAPTCCAGPDASTQPVPEAELGLSCGDPVAFSELREGDVVLDLGSGGGKDVFIAATKVGPKGRAIGVDMTAEMLALARKNAHRFKKSAGLSNVEFRRGTIENLPVEDDSVDVIISNCVINLSPDKAQVFREAFRVMRPGGRLIVSDIVLNRSLPPELKASKSLYTACIAGALLRKEYLAAARAAGFRRLKVLADHAYSKGTTCSDPVTSGAVDALEGAASSITLRAVKPRGR